MTSSHHFLNCIIKDIHGRPCTGIPVTLICVSHPTNGFQGITDASGIIWKWTRIRTEGLDQRQLFVQGLPGTLWRVTFDAHAHMPPDHPFPFATIDFFIPQEGDGNITFVLGPRTLNVYNSVAPFSAQQTATTADTPGQTGSPYLLGRRNSSSVPLSAMSDLTTFNLDERQPLLSDVGAPGQLVESPRGDNVSENGEVLDSITRGRPKRKRDAGGDQDVITRKRHRR
ncbi:hypothetical protein J7T55_011990 [Diaporthe amygdali]|uniref:uncharacterized protein n=1 Tax=Phomopsis amygdali TaxID=1214568 RepID=UPI0022FEA677|nr:uncharacterized protein J7T55_011990 [Diaporthe amygdali]KAJ0123525.1 hypothetical protein J7T55_011990 [Diaporthe amygdali]